ncbi:MAG TPA: zinc ABC transporter substrate-binding protein [Rhizomicrobium sp.]|nr:zinc ABC transporter substrate-binding protein [Rhizomicrobium sp.]
MRSALATALCVILAALPAHAAPKVLATIKPVQSLVASVMAGAGTPELLIQGAQSEHSYALKPSDAAEIGAAAVIFEIGPDLETYLTRPLATLAHGSVVVLESAPGVTRLPARWGGLWDETRAVTETAPDPHIWLDPENAVAMTAAIVDALSKADPAHAALYAANGRAEIARLKTQEKDLAARLAPLRGRRYIVFHDAYQYFERRFGLSSVGAVTVAPDRPVGPRRVSMLRDAIRTRGVACVFREPQFPPALIGTLIEGSPAHVGVLDPLGAALAPGPELYPKLLDAIAASLRGCLG